MEKNKSDGKITLIRLSLSLNSNGFFENLRTFEGVETNLSFKVSEKGVGYDFKIINKEKYFNKIETIHHITTTNLIFYTWCLPDKVEEMKLGLKQRIKTEVFKMQEELEKLNKFLTK